MLQGLQQFKLHGTKKDYFFIPSRNYVYCLILHKEPPHSFSLLKHNKLGHITQISKKKGRYIYLHIYVIPYWSVIYIKNQDYPNLLILIFTNTNKLTKYSPNTGSFLTWKSSICVSWIIPAKHPLWWIALWNKINKEKLISNTTTIIIETQESNKYY